jgi:hypothetical protein
MIFFMTQSWGWSVAGSRSGPGAAEAGEGRSEPQLADGPAGRSGVSG